MKIHIVKKGESLFSIAQKYGTTLEEVIQLNPEIANPDKIDVGMKVKVPSSTVKPVESDIMHQHSVKQGDTLWKLSKAWGVPLNEMIKANPQLKNPNALLVGEVVNIPKVTGGTTLPLEGTGIPKWQSMLPNVKVPTMPVAPAVTEKPLTAFQVPAEKPTPAGPPLKPHVDLFKQFNVQATEVMAMPEFPKTPEMPIAAMPHQPMPYGIGPMVLSTPEHWPCPPESPMNIPAGGISAMNMPASGFYPGVPGARKI